MPIVQNAPRGLVLACRLFAVATVAAVMLPLPMAAAHDYRLGDIEIAHPWSRATPPGAKTGAGYLRLSNLGAAADRLLAVSSPLAPKAEIHQMRVANGVMNMRALGGGIEIPAGGAVALEPGGIHIMLMGLSRPLVEGEKVPMTLTFEKAGTVDVALQVDKIGAGTPAKAGNGGHDHAPTP